MQLQGVQQACLECVQLSCARIGRHKLPVSSVRMEPLLSEALRYMNMDQVSSLLQIHVMSSCRRQPAGPLILPIDIISFLDAWGLCCQALAAQPVLGAGVCAV